MENHWSSSSYAPPPSSDDFFEFNKPAPSSIVPVVSSPSQASLDSESLNQLKLGFSKMMQTMERLEQRLNRVEQTTTQILKNQQEVLTAPFMSQTELDHARKVAEQLEHDTSVAKQLQAAYNKETEVRKNLASYSTMMGQCPLCGARVNQMELESHVEKCLELFSSDPKKQVEVKETKQKAEAGFFSRLYKTSKTEKTKVISNMPPSANTPLLSEHDGQQMMVNPSSYYPPPFAYPSYPPYSGSPHQPPHQPPHQMMMPMYMYHPGMHGTPNIE